MEISEEVSSLDNKNCIQWKAFPEAVKTRQRRESTTVSVQYEQHTDNSRRNGSET